MRLICCSMLLLMLGCSVPSLDPPSKGRINNSMRECITDFIKLDVPIKDAYLVCQKIVRG